MPQNPVLVTSVNANNFGPSSSISSTLASFVSGLAEIVVSVVTTAGINAAIVAANAAGGGTVFIPAGTYTLTGPLLPLPGVTVMGAGWSTTATSVLNLNNGTILQGNGTFDCFDWRNVDAASPYGSTTALHADFLEGFSIQNLAMTNFQYAVKIGALYQSGAESCYFNNLYASNCTAWGFWFENFSLSTFDRIYAVGNFQGIGFYASGGGVYNYGNSNMRRLFGGGNTANGCGRGILIQSRGGSQMNNVNVYDISGSSAAVTSTQAATMNAPAAATISNGSASIAVSNACQVGQIVQFSAAVGTGSSGVATGTNYYVVAAGLSSTTIEVSATLNGTPITFNASGTPNVNFCAIGITDMSQVGVGMPVHFSAAVNGLQTSVTYFILSTSGNTSGSGWITICGALGGNTSSASTARASSGSTALNAIFNGWPGVEVGGADQVSIITFLSITGNMDLEINYSPHFVVDGVQGGKFEFGITHSAGALNDIVIVNSQNIQLNNQQSSVTVYLDSSSQGATIVAGTTLVSGGGTGQTGFGLKQQTGTASLNLSCNNANGVDDIVCMPTLKQLQLNNALALQHSQQASGATLATSSGNLITYTSGTGTLTLPSLSSTNYVGWQYWVSNPGAGTLTVNSSQNIVGKGASGTSVTLATETCALFVAHNNAGTMYWAQYI